MIQEVTITNYLNQVLKLRLDQPEPEHGMIITSIEGLGPANANVNTTEIASGDGSIFNSSRLQERNIVMNLRFMFAPDIETVRLLTYKYFPIKRPLIFKIETDNRLCETLGYVESNEPNIFSEVEDTEISIICPDPYFYSISNNLTVFSGVRPLFEFPFENDTPASKDIWTPYRKPFAPRTANGLTVSMDENGVVTLSANSVQSYVNIALNPDDEDGTRLIDFKAGKRYLLTLEPADNDPANYGNFYNNGQVWIRPATYVGGTTRQTPQAPGPISDLNGNPNKNKVRLMSGSKRIGGMLFKVNHDYSISLYGRVDDFENRRFNTYPQLAVFDVINTEFGIRNNDAPYVLPTGDYILSDGGASRAGFELYMSLTITKKDGTTVYNYAKLPENPAFHIEESDISHIYLGICVAPGVELNEHTFYPMIRESSIADASYEPNYYIPDAALLPVHMHIDRVNGDISASFHNDVGRAHVNMPKFAAIFVNPLHMEMYSSGPLPGFSFTPWADFKGMLGIRMEGGVTNVVSRVKPGLREVNEIEFGAIELRMQQTVFYDGDAETGITIYIHTLGSVGDITIYNMQTRGKLTLVNDRIAEIIGSGLKRSDDIIISTVKGNIFATLIRDGYEYNIFNAIVRGAEWFQLHKGDNIFAYVAEFGGENLQFRIENRVAFEGV